MTVYSDQATEDETMTEKPPSMEDDSPVQTRQFLRSICVSRIALAICLPICLAVQVLHLKKNLIGGVMLVADAVGLACVVCAMIAHILSMKPRIERLQRHRIYCYLVFIAILVALILQPIIIAIRVLTTHKALPVERIDIARYAVLSITLIIGGSLRRGPKMCHEAEDRANVFDWSGSSILSFIGLFYVWPLVTRSWRADQLRPTDLPHLEQTMRQSGLREMLEDTVTGTWTERTLLYAAWKGKISIIISSLLLDALRTVASFVQIYSMHEIIDSFQNSAEHDRKYKQLMCVGLFLGSTAEVLLASYLSVRENYKLNLPTRMKLASMLFAKILKTADAAVMDRDGEGEENQQTQVINLLTIDCTTVASMSIIGPDLTSSIITLAVGVTFLYQMLGISAFVGIACIPLTSPLSTYIAKNAYTSDKAWSRHRDARISAIKEFLSSVKVIKLNAFEDYFRRSIRRLRETEVVAQRWRCTLGTTFNILTDQLPVIAILFTFTFHTKVLHRRLEPATAFVAIGVFNRIRESMARLPAAMNALLSTWVALSRLVTYLNQAEIEREEVDHTSVILEQATIAWPDSAKDAFRLNVSLQIPTGQMTVIHGATGSGKTLLLRALLGEAQVESGSVRSPRSRSRTEATPSNWLDNSVAYAPQQSFVRYGTVRDNILFGLPMWPERYEQCLREARLLSDLEIMPQGDRTEVGARGHGLSGGQRARINLARCLYSRASTIYLDDVLSAVDAHTARDIVRFCFGGGMIKGRTVILVTHHLSICLPVADYVVCLKSGTVHQAGISDKVMAAAEDDEEEHSGAHDTEETIDDTTDPAPPPGGSGSVSWKYYLFVLQAAGGGWYWLLLLFLYGTVRLMDVAQALWLERWSNDPSGNLDYYLGMYAVFVTSGVLAGGLRWIWLYGVGNFGFYNRGSRRIHEKALDAICDAPLSFFEETPSGRLLNIFGRDMYLLDAMSADAFGRTLSCALDVVSSAFIVSLQAPSILISMAIALIPLYWLTGVLRKLRADLRRLSASAASPLISLYDDTVEGVIMIRAFGIARETCMEMSRLINRESEVTLADAVIFNWVRAVIRIMANVVVSAVGFYLVSQGVTAARAGFVLSFAVATSQGLFSLLEGYSGLEQIFVSAERVAQQLEATPVESTDGVVPVGSWPSKGEIVIDKLCIGYKTHLPDVLHDVSVKIEPGMRVGIVGSTGSGKSTLALAILRAMEARSGAVRIDGVNTSSMPIRALRRRLNMVVQDSSLQAGTLRDALDLTQTLDDVEIYEALQRVHLLTSHDPTNPFANLDTAVARGGDNFSHGQRQLLCLARALLKKSRILIMDEATSSVDLETDEKITQTIKESFAGTTVITIAHRLRTIIQYDRVLVLGRGKVLEYGSPRELMQREGSAFHKLCMAQGEKQFSELDRLSRQY